MEENKGRRLSPCTVKRKGRRSEATMMCSELLSQTVFSNARWLKGISKTQFFCIPKCQNLEIHQIMPSKQGIFDEFSKIPKQTKNPSEILLKKRALDILVECEPGLFYGLYFKHWRTLDLVPCLLVDLTIRTCTQNRMDLLPLRVQLGLVGSCIKIRGVTIQFS